MTTGADRAPAWYQGEAADRPGLGRLLYTADRFLLFYMLNLKCGCTFIRNLLYHLDHDRLHPDSARIHAHDHEFFKAGQIPDDFIRNSPHFFIVVRDPVDRFLSLYFDKIADLSNRTDAWMRQRIQKGAGLKIAPDLSLTDHRQNCLKTLEWFRRNLDDGTEGRTNPHWQRQSHMLTRMLPLEPTLITLDGLSWQLPVVLGSLIPDIRARMDAVTTRNASHKLFEPDDFLIPEINESVREIYAMDTETYAQTRLTWGEASTTAEYH